MLIFSWNWWQIFRTKKREIVAWKTWSPIEGVNHSALVTSKPISVFDLCYCCSYSHLFSYSRLFELICVVFLFAHVNLPPFLNDGNQTVVPLAQSASQRLISFTTVLLLSLFDGNHAPLIILSSLWCLFNNSFMFLNNLNR